MHFVSNYFKKQNWGIKIGFIALVVSIVFLILGLTLIGTANFVPKDYSKVEGNLVGNGFKIMYNHGLTFLPSVYEKLQGLYNYTKKDDFVSAPLMQLLFGSIFLIILLPIASGISVLSLLGGYFKRWLYT